ncbi:MAG: response regulator, partial [Campylobacterota bacterium]|nr:response regulator [Campylobacterota bacterium]
MQTLNEKLVAIAADITVLYAEDNSETRTQYENIFKLLFKEVKSAENGAIALEEYKSKKYDLVITDLTMPVLDGVRLISEILDI